MKPILVLIIFLFTALQVNSAFQTAGLDLFSASMDNGSAFLHTDPSVSLNPADLGGLQQTVITTGGGLWQSMEELPVFFVHAGFPTGPFGLGLQLQTFGPDWYREWYFSISAGLQWAKILNLGIRANLFSLFIEGSTQSTSLGLDAGLLFRINPAVHFSATLKNLSSPPYPGDPYNRMNPVFTAGFRFYFYRWLHGAISVKNSEYGFTDTPVFGAGLSAGFGEHLRIQAGVTTDPLQLRTGLLIKVQPFSIAYTMIYHTGTGYATHLLGFSLPLTQLPEHKSCTGYSKLNINTAAVPDLIHTLQLTKSAATRLYAAVRRRPMVRIDQICTVAGITGKHYSRLKSRIACGPRGETFFPLPDAGKLYAVNSWEFRDFLAAGFPVYDSWLLLRFRENRLGYYHLQDLLRVPGLSKKAQTLIKQSVLRPSAKTKRNGL